MPGPGAYLIGEEEKTEILEVLQYGHLSRYGNADDPGYRRKVVTFEKEFSKECGVAHAVAVSSGTGAIMAALAALDIGPGDEVIVPGYTFIATMSAVMLMGATPVLSEIDESLTMDPGDIEKRVSSRTKAVIPVHMLGNPSDLDPILAVAKRNNIHVIEDACQAAGAKYKGKSVGSYGRLGAFSLNVFKTITAGDGGVVITNEGELYEKTFGFHDQGHKPLRMGLEIGNRSILGMNLRINELTGAIALAQLRKLAGITQKLRKNKALLKEYILGIPGVGFRKINDQMECGTLLTLLLEDKSRSDRVADRLKTKTVAHSGWHVYNNMEHILKKLDIEPHSLPATDQILDRAINISIGVVDAGLGSPFGIDILSTEEEIERKGKELRKILIEA